MVKRFGPTRGAGTVIVEQEGEKAITPGALGWAGYAGVFERGPVNELVLVGSKAELRQRMGGIIPDGLAADAASDYFDNSNGAGGLALVRITDGNEKQASSTLYTRQLTGASPMGTLKAANGGRWGGKAFRVSADLDAIAGLTNTTLQLPAAIASTFTTDRFKGGYVELANVANSRYPIIGSTKTGLIMVATDQKMRDAYNAAGGTNLRFYISLDNDGKGLSYRITDGEDRPDSEFGIEVYLNGDLVKKWGNLHTDPLNARYWVNLINNDTSNYYVVAEDLWTGAHTAETRPANYFAKTQTVTQTVLTANISSLVVNSAGGGNPTAQIIDDANASEDTLTVTMTSPTAGNVVSSRYGTLATALTLGTNYVPPNKWIPTIKITAGTTPLAAGDKLTFIYRPFRRDALVGGYLYPDKPNAKLEQYRIVGNTANTITVAAGSNLTTSGAPNDMFMVSAPHELWGGADGNADVADTDYIDKAWSVDRSPFNNVSGQNLGLVKFATPGITSTAVQKAGAAYAEAKNHQYRYEAPANVTTEQAVLSLVNDTLGRSDYAVLAWPSYGYVPDPDPTFAREGRLKVVPLTGQIHGREARIASDYDGYHKAAAGIDATLPRVLKVPTGDRQLNEELLNPAGIATIKKKQGNYVIWGDRTLHRDPTWRYKHQREQMSYYEQTLEAAFDFLTFAINDQRSDGIARAALNLFFRPEYAKRALRGDKFEDAAIIRVDSEINTDLTRSAGDKYAEVSLRLADTVERFIIKIGKQGIFESVA